MSAAVRLWQAIGRRLPKGFGDLGRQLAIFAAFDIAYELSRVLMKGDRATAMRHARSVVSTERTLGLFHELDVQRFARESPGIVQDIANWTYFNCQFTITFAFVLWVYLRRNDAYPRLRNTIIAIDVIGVLGYLLYPTAPPRMLSNLGFVDTLDQTGVNHHSGLIAALANPYAAMPSLHTAYAVTLGATGILLARRTWQRVLWAGYAPLVVFSIVATANHFLLDAIAGAAVAVVAASLTVAVQRLRLRTPALSAPEPAYGGRRAW